MKKLKKNDNKGFTLVELIVVLVILAILAAILVPALLGYIDRAKQQQIVLNAKSCLTAAQAELSSKYATDTSDPSDFTDDEKERILDTADVKDVCDELVVACEKSFKDGWESTEIADKRAAYKITYVKYTEGSQTIYFNGSSWVTEEPEDIPDGVHTIQ